MKCTLRVLLTLALSFSAGISCLCGNAQPELTADDPIEFSQADHSLTAKQNAALLYLDTTVQADEITFKTEESKIDASGNVRFTHKATRAVADHVTYQFKDKYITAEPLRLGHHPVYLGANHLEGPLGNITLSDSTAYLGEPDPFSLNVKAKQIVLSSENNTTRPDTVSVKSAVFRIGKVPFFFFPAYSHSLRQYPVSIHSDLSFRDSLGFFVRNDILFTSRPNFQWGALLDYYTKRGLLIGPQLNYNLPLFDHSSYLEGNLMSGYISDQGHRSFDALMQPVPKDRYFINNQEHLQLGENFSAIGQLRWWRDSEVVRDFRPKLFNNNQEPDNFGEAVYSGKNYYISAFTRFRPNDYQRVQERLPEVNFDLTNTPILCTGIYHRGNINYAYLKQKDPILGTPELYSNRLDGYYGLNYPINITKALVVTPVVGGRITHYLSTSSADEFTRLRGQVGVDIDLNTFGQWDCCNDFWNINGIRHIFRPVVRYRYIPQTHSGSGVIPRIERDLFTTNLKPIDLGNLRNRDDAREIHTLRFGVENLLQTRHKEYGSTDLAYLNIYQDVRFSPLGTENDYSDLFTELGLFPARWLNFKLFSRFDPENLTLRELRTRLQIVDGRVWSLEFSSDNLIHTTDQYLVGVQWHATSRATLSAQWRFDARLNELTEQVYGLRTRLGNTWVVNYKLVHRQGTRREDDIRFGVDIGLIGL